MTITGRGFYRAGRPRPVNPGLHTRITVHDAGRCDRVDGQHPDSANVAAIADRADDGVEAMAFVRRQGKYSAMHQPDLIILDLNLPRKNGREVLAELKADPELSSIPVVVLTTSHAEQDIVASYNLHANCYVTKPVDLDLLESILALIAMREREQHGR